MDRNADDSGPAPALPEMDDVQRVDTERMDDRQQYRFGRQAGGADVPPGFGVFSFTSAPGAKPPTLAAWICLVIAWLFLGSKIPFTVLLGIPFDLAALFLGMMCLSRGGLVTGIGVLLLGTVGSLVVYLIGLFRFLALAV